MKNTAKQTRLQRLINKFGSLRNIDISGCDLSGINKDNLHGSIMYGIQLSKYKF